MVTKRVAIVLFYKGDLHIDRMITSLERQQTPLDKIVIIDDHSDSECFGRLTERFRGHARVQIARNKANLGPHESVMQFLRGYKERAHIYLCDQDDEWLDTKVKVVEKHIAENASALVVTNALVEEDGCAKRVMLGSHPGGFWSLFIKNKIPGCFMCFDSRDIELLFPYPKKVSYDHWIALVFALWGRGRIVLVEDPQMRYVRHAGTLTKLDRRRRWWVIVSDRLRIALGLATYLMARSVRRSVVEE